MTTAVYYWETAAAVEPRGHCKKVNQRNYQTGDGRNCFLESLNGNNQYSLEWESISGMRTCSVRIKA